MKKILSAIFCVLAIAQAASAQCPTPYFSHTLTQTCANPLQVTFGSSMTITYNDQIINDFWLDFKDGTPPQLVSSGFGGPKTGPLNPVFSNVVHDFTAPGSYNVKLTLVQKDSHTLAMICKDSAFLTVNVNYPNSIDGYLLRDISGPIDAQYRVWLYRYNQATNKISMLDSINVTSVGNQPTWYEFPSLPCDNYLLKAQMMNDVNKNYLPTYVDSALKWKNGQVVQMTGFALHNWNINMRRNIPTTGPGKISGQVKQGHNKGTSTGIEGQVVFLLDANNEVIKSVSTDANGDFFFTDLPLGSYGLYPESENYTTTPITGITLTSNTTTLWGFEFGKDGDEIKPRTTSVADVATKNYAIFPNPANNKLSINWAKASQNVTVTISTLAGQKIYESATAVTSNKTEVNIANIPAGIYFLTVEADSVKHTQKLVVQH